jgi:hypothetical protein
MHGHQDVCVYWKIKCPLHLSKMCSWYGFKNKLKEHVNAAHPNNFFRSTSFQIRRITESAVIFYCFDDLFTCYQKIKDGRFYCVVQLIGASSEASKYTCEFTLRAANGIEQISKTFLVHGYSEDCETIFNSGKCLNLDEDTVLHFCVDDELDMIVKMDLSFCKLTPSRAQ